MKYSKYNIIYADGQLKYIYNSHSDGLIAVTEDLYELVMRYENQIGQLQEIHPTLYEAMCNKGFIVDAALDEYKSVVEKIIYQSENPTTIHITINPTMDCNFRCWYCYENHNVGSKMSCGTMQRVKKMLSKVLSKTGVQRLVLSFFGGEPLLYYQNVMVPLMQYAKEECVKLDKELDIYITTNGFLLDDKKIKELQQYDYVSIQVPVDGDKNNHDKVKYLKTGEGTFDKVIDNVHHAVEAGIAVTVRCNYTNKNVASFSALKSVFNDLASRNNIEFSFHKVWQEDDSDVLQKHMEVVMEELERDGLSSTANIGGRGLCYADYKYNLVVNYNGDVYKCTARNFTEENKLGTIEEDGTVSWNIQYQKRLECKYKSYECSICEIFPICMQGCSQSVFEQENVDECTFKYSPHDKEKIVRERIKSLIN